MQKVDVIVCIAGDYCAFHEMSISVEYDLTNDKQVSGSYSKEELEERMDSDECYDGYSDYQEFDAILVDGKYYVNI